MTISFCGHSDFCKTKEHEQKLMSFLEEKVGHSAACMYLGGYGNFDEFAYSCCKKYKEKHKDVSLIFITPYITPEYQRNRLVYEKARFDAIIYPQIEDKPLRFAITYRNKYMMESADHVVAYVNSRIGGAYKAYKYAKKLGKPIFNLASFE